MKEKLTLVIMAAGMGSRFGGLKQIEPFGPNGEYIIDYDIYDAIKSGFSKVVFIIKEENFSIFKETIGKRIEKHIEVCYAFQDTTKVPEQYLNKERTKPWGTGHAILCAKDYVNENFVVINADDYYGYDALKVASNFIKEKTGNQFATVCYHVKNTITKNGSVKRGVCLKNNNHLDKLIESVIEEKENEFIATPLNGDESFKIKPNTLVSMNLLCFTPSIFNILENDFNSFLKENSTSLTKEFLIPEVLYNSIKTGLAQVEVLETTSIWHGVTYKEDKEEVVNAINDMIDKKIYPKNLWN